MSHFKRRLPGTTAIGWIAMLLLGGLLGCTAGPATSPGAQGGPAACCRHRVSGAACPLPGCAGCGYHATTWHPWQSWCGGPVLIEPVPTERPTEAIPRGMEVPPPAFPGGETPPEPPEPKAFGGK